MVCHYAFDPPLQLVDAWHLCGAGSDSALHPQLEPVADLAIPARHRKRHDDSTAHDGGLEISAATHTPARTGAVCNDRHVRTQSFDLAGRALDRRIVRLALGV